MGNDVFTVDADQYEWRLGKRDRGYEERGVLVTCLKCLSSSSLKVACILVKSGTL